MTYGLQMRGNVSRDASSLRLPTVCEARLHVKRPLDAGGQPNSGKEWRSKNEKPPLSIMKITDARAVAFKGWWGLRGWHEVMAEASREKVAENAGSMMHLLNESHKNTHGFLCPAPLPSTLPCRIIYGHEKRQGGPVVESTVAAGKNKAIRFWSGGTFPTGQVIEWALKKHSVKKKKKSLRASLVAQWWRIHLPMQEMWVWSLVQEDPTCHGATKPVHRYYWPCALEPGSCNYWSPSALEPRSTTREATTTRRLYIAIKSSPSLMQLKKAHGAKMTQHSKKKKKKKKKN